MKTSESIDKLAEALSAAQGEYGPVIKNKINPHFKNRYADLSAIFDATRPALSKHGLCLTQAPTVHEARVIVASKLLHKSGQWIEAELSLKPASDTPQAVGSAITYAKRYSAQAILGVDAEDDDDANEAQGKPKEDNEGNKTLPKSFNKPESKPDPRLAAAQTLIFYKNDLQQLKWLQDNLTSKGIDRTYWPLIIEKLDGKDIVQNLPELIKELHESVAKGVL